MITSKQIQNSITNAKEVLLKNSVQIGILIVLVIVVSLFFHQGRGLQYSYQVDDIARDPVIAPFNFPILKTEEKLKIDLDEALRSEPYLFQRNQEGVQYQIIALREYFLLVTKIRSASDQLDKTKELLYRYRHDEKYEEVRSMYRADSTTRVVLQNQYEKDYPTLATENERFSILDPQEPFQSNQSLDQFYEELLQICKNRWAEGIVDIDIAAIISDEVSIDQGDIPILLKPKELNDLNIAWTHSKKEINSLYSDEADIRRELGYNILVEFMKPNIIYGKEITERRQKNRLDIVPRNQGIMLKNEMIIDANQRITPDIYQKLTSLSIAIGKLENREKGWDQVISYLGR